MDVVDSDRYRAAVDRLRRLLYDPPSWDAPPTMHPDHALHSTHAAYTASHYSTVSSGGDVEGHRLGVGSAPSRWVLEMLRHQEDLIAQLEKENEFLKREIVTVGEGVKSMAKENTDLSRRLTEALNQAINVGEGSDTSSYNLEEIDEALQKQMATLSRERALLQEEVIRLEGTLSAVTKREQEALGKLNHALALAQDTHAHTAKVRASSESALEEVTNLLTATQQESRELRRVVEGAEERLKRQERHNEERESQQQQRVQRLEDERDDLEQEVAHLKAQVRDAARKNADMEEDLQVARAARLRLEAQLEEQRQHSKDAHARLEQIVTARSGEAAAGAARARELEDRLSSARQDSNRLLQAITSMTQATGRTGELDTTDDVKSERRAAEMQLSATLAALQTKHEDEVMKLREAADRQSEGMKMLKDEVERMRKQLSDDSEKYRICLDEVGRGLAALSTHSSDIKFQPLKSKTTDGAKEVQKDVDGVPTSETLAKEEDSKVEGDQGGTDKKESKPKELSSNDGNGDEEKEHKGTEDAKEELFALQEGSDEAEHLSLKKDIQEETTEAEKTEDNKEEEEEDKKGGEEDKMGAEEEKKGGEEDKKGGEEDKKGGEEDKEERKDDKDEGDDDSKDEDDAKGGSKDGTKDDDDDGDAQGTGKDHDGTDETEGGGAGSTDKEGADEGSEAKGEEETQDSEKDSACEEKENDCYRCENWAAIFSVVGEAMQGLQLDIDRQAVRLDRLSAREISGCENCLKHQIVLGAVYSRLDHVDQYSHMLGSRIESLSYRLLSC